TEFSNRYNLEYNSIKIKNLKSRWGSCSSKKNLSFNLKLMYFNHKVIDYVIIHELCHLKIMNHSREFWNLVESIIPDYKERKSELNR
ncbi:MAG: M48 family metallopeptidase, partial [Melioribacteraceae bacterium]|nr:M48 family metallopeptidase [Melioribacteraceae bacterium]